MLLDSVCKGSIRKYGNTSYEGMGQVQNGLLYMYMYLRYRSDFAITKAEHCKAFTHKTLHYSMVEGVPRIPPTFFKVKIIVRKNIHFVVVVVLFLLSIL